MTVTDVAKILGGEKTLRRKIKNQMDWIELIDTGVTKSALSSLAGSLNFSMHQLAGLLPVTERTIQRYSPGEHFNAVVSEHIIQIAEVAAKGAEVFKDKEAFNTWLNLPNKALANRKPVTLLKTKFGADMVIDLLVRIEHGTYS